MGCIEGARCRLQPFQGWGGFVPRTRGSPESHRGNRRAERWNAVGVRLRDAGFPGIVRIRLFEVHQAIHGARRLDLTKKRKFLDRGRGQSFADGSAAVAAGRNFSLPHSAGLVVRNAGCQTCCVADCQIGRLHANPRPAGMETCDTADLEVCATAAMRSRDRAHRSGALTLRFLAITLRA